MSTKSSIIIHGPQGCGKTHWASTLAAVFGQTRVIELDAPENQGGFKAHGALGITNDAALATRISRKFRGANRVEVFSFDGAVRRLPTELRQAIVDWREGSTPAAAIAYNPATAPGILQIAADAIADRAAARDQPGGERSMARTVAAFNAITGHTLSEREGWLFMAQLKAARAWGGNHHADDYVDGAAYFGLAGEAAAKGLPA